MSDRRTFLGNAAAAAVIAKISALRSFGFKSDRPQTIHPTISDREEAGLRGSVRMWVEETTYPTGKSLTTTEYGLDGRLLTTRTSNPDGSEWFTTKTYDADRRLVKTVSGKSGEPATETLYGYDEAGRLKETRDADGKGNLTSYRYDQQGRKSEIKTFAPEMIERYRKAVLVDGSLWDAAQAGFGVPAGGNVTTIFGENDNPTEARIHDAEGRLVSRFVRTYDANGRIIEENHILENPALMFESSGELDDKQLEAKNKALKSMMSGRRPTGKWFMYDSQGRVTEVRDRNWGSDVVTTTSYNEHGDKSEERMTIMSNLVYPPGVAYTIDEEGTLIPVRRDGVSEPPPDLERTLLNITEYRYEYDQDGNWTERTIVFREVVDSSESGGYSTAYRRSLTYF